MPVVGDERLVGSVVPDVLENGEGVLPHADQLSGRFVTEDDFGNRVSGSAEGVSALEDRSVRDVA